MSLHSIIRAYTGAFHSFQGPNICIQRTWGHGLFSSRISCPCPADWGGFLLASRTLFLLSQSSVFGDEIFIRWLTPPPQPTQMCSDNTNRLLADPRQSLNYVWSVYVTFQHSHFLVTTLQISWAGLKNLKAGVCVLHAEVLWGAMFSVCLSGMSCFRLLWGWRSTFCLLALNLPPAVAQSIVVSSSPVSSVGPVVPENRAESGELVEEGVTCLPFRKWRVSKKPACRLSGMWYFWFTHSYVATLKLFLKGRHYSINTHTQNSNQIVSRTDFMASWACVILLLKPPSLKRGPGWGEGRGVGERTIWKTHPSEE